VLDREVREATADGCGPVHALDRALRQSLSQAFDCLGEVQLTDYKVRVLDADKATAAKVRVLIQSRDDQDCWTTVGVSDNVIDASWQALADSVNYKLHRTHGATKRIENSVCL
jgi:2-isopropylmalate synthase